MLYRMYISSDISLYPKAFAARSMSGNSVACFASIRNKPQKFIGFYTKEIMEDLNRAWNESFPGLKVNLRMYPVKEGFRNVIDVSEKAPDSFFAVLQPKYHEEMKNIPQYWTLPIIVHRILSLNEDYLLYRNWIKEDILNQVLNVGRSYDIHNICNPGVASVEELLAFFRNLSDPHLVQTHALEFKDKMRYMWNARQSELIKAGLDIFNLSKEDL